MTVAAAPSLEPFRALTDEEIVARIVAGQTELFEIIMRRHNQRLYRACVAILRNDAQAEDVVQDAYVRAYQHLSQFAGRAKFSTWLTRIAVHEALGRIRGRRRVEELDAMPEEVKDAKAVSTSLNPEEQVANRELGSLLENSVERLPEQYRIVFMLREIEEATTQEVAEILEISEENVKTRLHRARVLLRKSLFRKVGAHGKEAFAFHATRCDRVVAKVFARIGYSAIN
ncbi:MAG TPA: RNA polymerase sigma factor [Terriglobales bacterium]|nr:RNA polymerase sigma factor [Terriglobales bacterium]